MKLKPRTKPETVTVGNVMVKIYEHQRRTSTEKKRTDFLIADYTSGVRRLRSFADHGKARSEALKIARQLASGDATAATMRNSEAASYGRAVELLRPTGAALEVAAGAYAKSFEILGGDAVIEAANFYKRHRADQVTHKRVADVVAELIASKEARGKSGRYVGGLSARLKRFATTFAVDISAVTTADVQKWLDGLKLAPQTVKNFRACLWTLFAFAESRGYIFKGGNPVEDTETISVKGGDIQIFTPDEITDLLKAATKEFLPVIAIGAFAGVRSAEIGRLEWRDIDQTGGFITIAANKAKTASRRIVPIVPNLSQWLARYARRKGKIWKGTTNDLQDARAATVKAAGVAWKDNGLRHSFISYRLASIQNAAQVALEAGNSPAMVFKHYREIVRPAAALTWFAIAPEMPANVVQFAAARIAK